MNTLESVLCITPARMLVDILRYRGHSNLYIVNIYDFLLSHVRSKHYDPDATDRTVAGRGERQSQVEHKIYIS